LGYGEIQSTTEGIYIFISSVITNDVQMTGQGHYDRLIISDDATRFTFTHVYNNRF
jgi:hypothetical protein